MEAEEYRRRLLASAAASQAAANMLLQMLPKHPTPEQWALYLRNLYPQVMEARRQSFAVSSEFYTSQREARGLPQSTAPEFVERSYPPERLERAMEPVRARLVGLEDFERAEAEARKAEREAEGIVERHGAGAGRSAIEDATDHDKAALGWARVPSGAETCAFCTMLTSRGPVYKTEQSAMVAGPRARNRKVGEPYHNHCDCIVVPVFDKADWPGRDAYIEAQHLWYEHGSLKALRAFYNSAEDRTSGA